MSTTAATAAPPGRGPVRIMMVAGEASGDLHGADLARELLARRPELEIYGIAGAQMRRQGVRALIAAEAIAGLGLTELASTIGRTLRALSNLRRRLRRERPALLILIDFAEFNMALAKSARKAGVPVLYYITPQVWAWRRGRIKKLVRLTDKMAVVFPFEAELFNQAGGHAVFVGHPLLDRLAPAGTRDEILARHGLPPGSKLLALLPGSRAGELGYLLGPMVAAARALSRQFGLLPCLALAHTLTRQDLLRQAARAGVDLENVHIIENDTYSIVSASEVALVASGTATLETALLGCPMVIAYKMSGLTYLAARLLITGVQFIGMPNILAGRAIVPELIQSGISAESLARAAAGLMVEPKRSEVRAALREIAARLGQPGAASRVADMALEMIP